MMTHDSVAENRPTLFRFKSFSILHLKSISRNQSPNYNTIERVNISGYSLMKTSKTPHFYVFPKKIERKGQSCPRDQHF
jgi:hypothetical protein